MTAPRAWHVAGWGICALFSLLALLTFTEYGITWDEPIQSEYGERALRYYTSGFRDVSNESLSNLADYGPFFEMFAALISRLQPERESDVRHALIVITAILTVIGVMKIAASGWGPAAGAFAAIFLVLTPHFYGHGFNNSKDIPFACGVTWTIWAAARCMRLRTATSVFLAGTILGLTMAIRVGGVFLLPIIAAAVLVGSSRQTLRRDLLHLLMLGTSAWVAMVLLWPAAHSAPIGQPLDALRKASSFSDGPDTFFDGTVWPAGSLPRRYLPQMFALTTPLPLLALTIVGFALIVSQVARDSQRRGQFLLIVLWVAMPVVVYFVRKPPVYDGIRHFLFLVPAMAIAAAAALERLRLVHFGNLIAGAVFVALLPTVVTMARLHPYQSTYFNEVAGGVAAASQRYETDYWLNSYREALLWINDHPCEPVTRVLVSPPTPGIVATYAGKSTEAAYTVERGVRGALPAQFDYYLATTRFHFAANFPETPVRAAIGREGAVFTVIRGGCRGERSR